MSRFTIRLMTALWLIYLLLVQGSALAGSMMPPAPVMVIRNSIFGDSALTESITIMDLRAGGIYHHTIPAGWYEYTSRFASNCLIATWSFANNQSLLSIFDFASHQFKQYALHESVRRDAAGADWFAFLNLSPDRRFLALSFWSHGRRMLGLVDLHTGAELYLDGDQTPKSIRFTWSPDNRHFLIYDDFAEYGSSFKTFVGDAFTGDVRYLTDIRLNYDERFWRWSSDGKYILGLSGVQMVVIDAATGQLTRSSDALTAARAAWIPGTHRILFKAGSPHDGAVNGTAIWDIDRDTVLAQPAIAPAVVFGWSPDSRTLAWLTLDDTLHINLMDSPTFAVHYHTALPLRQFSSVQWSPDGRYLAVASFTQEDAIVIVDTLEQQLITWQAGANSRWTYMNWLPDSSGFVYYIGQEAGYKAEIRIVTLQAGRLTQIARYTNRGDERVICFPEAGA